jgi:hypothetical protein
LRTQFKHGLVKVNVMKLNVQIIDPVDVSTKIDRSTVIQYICGISNLELPDFCLEAIHESIPMCSSEFIIRLELGLFQYSYKVDHKSQSISAQMVYGLN